MKYYTKYHWQNMWRHNNKLDVIKLFIREKRRQWRIRDED